MVASLSLRALALLSTAWLANCASSVDVSLNFYTSIDCKSASTITPSANLNLSTCFVSPGLVSLQFSTVLCAGGGSAFPYLFSDTSCGDQQGILDWYRTGSDYHCYSDYASGSIAAFMLSCNQDSPEKPVATSTVSVAPVATGAPAATSSAKSSNSSGQSDDGNNNDDNNGDNNAKTGWNALSMGARIGIIVAAAVVGLILFGSIVWRLISGHNHPPRRDPPPDVEQRYPTHPPYPPYPPPDRSSKAPTISARHVVSPIESTHMYSPPPESQRWDSPAQERQWRSEVSGEDAFSEVDAPPVPPTELPGSSSTSFAYVQVLDDVARSATQHALGGQFDTGTQTNTLPSYQAAVASNVLSVAFDKNDPEWKHRQGAAGELYVFEYLKSLGLPNFGRHNWTSSLRTLVDGLPQYKDMGPSRDGIADFEYHDEHGAFTSFLIDRGYENQGIRRGTKPTYRFEVKATTSPNWRAPFYVSDNQEQHIRDSLITPGQTDNVYIICRIFNLGGGDKTRMNIYLDPESLKRQGRLHFFRGANEDNNKWTVQPA